MVRLIVQLDGECLDYYLKFQFLMVRLIDERGRFKFGTYVISIPYGSINRYRDFNISGNSSIISIPYGSINSINRINE